MAKTHGQVNEDTGKVETRKVKRHRAREIPWTPGPKTRAQKIARNLWG